MKKIFTILLSLATVTTALAGGPMTNTNQSAAFLRSIARGTTLDTDAVYNNPAGTVFMEDGWHLGINNQMAKQTRTITSSFAPFNMGINNMSLLQLDDKGYMQYLPKEFTGEVFSPLVPSVHLTWKKNRWAVMLGMGVNGGGGSLEFNDGLGSFERQFAVLPMGMQQLGVNATKYGMDMYLKGSSQTLAFNAGVAFRITDWLSAAAMVRYSTSSNAYEGYMKNISVLVGNKLTPASAIFGNAFSQLQNQLTGLQAQYEQVVGAYGADSEAAQQLAAGMQQVGEAMTTVGTNAVKTADHILDVKQTGYSISPVLALYFQKGKWAASAKYEFKMATELEIESAEVSANDAVINALFPNGAKVKAETPALLALAASRECGPVKITAEYHLFFDKDAENSFSSCIEGNTMEYLLGAEWQISKKWLVSCGAQRTQLNMNENAYSDMNYSISSWSTAIGAAYQVCDMIRINVGLMPTFYDEATAVGKDSNGIDFKDVYNRTSMAWGIGLDFKF
ncbi:MAG: hypothetical protein IKY68_02555 [Alistipes sp.]|nr:hypothetical protein [Alistipes sp.]